MLETTQKFRVLGKQMKALLEKRVLVRMVYGGCGLLGALTINMSGAIAGTLNTLVIFNGTNGAHPYAGLIQDKNGNLYGTTAAGGANNNGTVFKLNPANQQLTTLVSFNGTNGAYPNYGGLIQDKNGNLYGITAAGGADNNGTVFKFNPATQQLTTLVSFNGTNGAYPHAGLIQDKTGNLYGTTAYGGANNNGTVFKFNPATQQLTTLVIFNYTNGANPYAGLIQDKQGNLYGTTLSGGANEFGTVFKLDPDTQQLITLVNFNYTNGANPYAGLIQDKKGNLYGTTVFGGANDDGTVFELNPDTQQLTTLVSFNGTNGANPYAGLIQDKKGNLYGTTAYGGANDDGTVFELNPDTQQLTTLVSFDGTNGNYPYAGLIQDKNGNLYGTTYGGVNDDGTVFELVP